MYYKENQQDADKENKKGVCRFLAWATVEWWLWKEVWDGGKSTCKCPEAGVCLSHSRNSMEWSVAGVEGTEERSKRENQKVDGDFVYVWRLCWPLLGLWLYLEDGSYWKVLNGEELHLTQVFTGSLWWLCGEQNAGSHGWKWGDCSNNGCSNSNKKWWCLH